MTSQNRNTASRPNTYIGPRRPIDPSVRILAVDPGRLDPAAKAAALDIARRESKNDVAQNKVLIPDGRGNFYWGAEFPHAFSFSGQLRGEFERVYRDPAQNADAGLSGALAMSNHPEGRHTHVVMEFDDGELLLFRRTSDTVSAAKQTFDVASTKGARNGTPRRDIDTQDLADVVAVPGERLTIGGHTSDGRINRITAINVDSDDLVPTNHPWFKDAGRMRDPMADFTEAMNIARQAHAAASGGAVALHRP